MSQGEHIFKDFFKFTSIPFEVGALLFTEGFVILALQILGNKILSPYVGTTLPVWGALIGVILLGSMCGYYLGGYIADTYRTKRVFLGLALGTTVLILLIPSVRHVLETFVEDVSYGVGAFFGSLILFYLPVLCASAIITYTIRAFVRTHETIAQVHGDFYAIATAGSIAGVFVTSYVLVPLLTIPHMLYMLAFINILCAVWATRKMALERAT